VIDVFDEIDKSVHAALKLAQTRMGECEVLTDQAMAIVEERIGVERAVEKQAFLGARDGGLYEARAEAAQKKAGQAAALERIALSIAERRWEKMHE
jgi:hypothetical protein